MRVIAGELRGRIIQAPKGTGTRPTSDRVREATFSRIQSLHPGGFDGASVLDAFAGTGALGIEALSRGATRATFVERDRTALDVLRRNIESLGVSDRSTVVPLDVLRAVESLSAPTPFTLLFLDPPYRIDKSEVRGLIESLMRTGRLCVGALVVWEHATGDACDWPEAFESTGTRKYGSTEVDIAIYTLDEEGIR